MTRQIPKPVAAVASKVFFGAVNAGLMAGGQLCVWWDDATAWCGRTWWRLLDEWDTRHVGDKAEDWLRRQDGAQ